MGVGPDQLRKGKGIAEKNEWRPQIKRPDAQEYAKNSGVGPLKYVGTLGTSGPAINFNTQ